MADPQEVVIGVLVLGDIGRSPRMMNHALSFARKGHSVRLMGYNDSEVLPEIIDDPRIQIVPIRQPGGNAGSVSSWRRYAIYLWKLLFLMCQLFSMLPSLFRCSFIVVQNPPSLPSLPFALVVSWLTFGQTKLLIDWHNYGASILSLTLRTSHPLVRLCAAVENFCGRRSHGNLCVSQAMQKDLKTKGIQAHVLYDRAASRFHPLSASQKQDTLKSLASRYPALLPATQEDSATRIVLSSTSWTPDEDFQILLTALDDYETESTAQPSIFPALVCIITGKGPLKAHYEREIAARAWQRVRVIAPWLEADEYPRVVASADIGVCLHTSSSGLDLPMKVVDMLATGLPVLAVEFPCIHELVRDNENGRLFRTSRELSSALCEWFALEDYNSRRQRFVNAALEFRKISWDDAWSESCYDVFISPKGR